LKNLQIWTTERIVDKFTGGLSLNCFTTL